MKKLIVFAVLAAAACVALAMTSGCASNGGPYFQKTRQGQAHSQNDRIYNPNDYRYHERHATGIDSHTND